MVKTKKFGKHEIESIIIPEKRFREAISDCSYDIQPLGHRTPIEVPLAIGEYLGLEGKTVCDLGCSYGYHFPNWARCGASSVIGVEKSTPKTPSSIPQKAHKSFPSTDFKIYRGNYFNLLQKYPEKFEADVYYAWGFAKKKQSFKDSYVELKKLIGQNYFQCPNLVPRVDQRTHPKYLVSFHGIQFLEDALSISDKVIHFESKEWINWKRAHAQSKGKHRGKPRGQGKPPWSWSKDFFLGIHVIE